MMNRQTEIREGIRKEPSEIEKLAEQRVILQNGIKFMLEQNQPYMKENLLFHQSELKKVDKKLKTLSSGAVTNEVSEAMRAAVQKSDGNEAEMRAIQSAWAKQNPGKTVMEFGGEETQKLFDQFAALPPSADIQRGDVLTCGYCGKSDTQKLHLCSRCKMVAYCNKECQTAAWSGHKKVCAPKNKEAKKEDQKKEKLPLTWEQLEAFGQFPAEGKVG
jgi:hypothetical protein